jgi:hypothetical protein
MKLPGIFPDYTRERLSNGVVVRADNKGDSWARTHRQALSNGFYMQDVDGYCGLVGFAGNTGEKLFQEYEPFYNTKREFEDCAMVAFFDRKRTEDAAKSKEISGQSRAFYLWQCRAFAQLQPIAPKFFYVIGYDEPPWTLIELDITTAAEVSRHKLDGMDWNLVWHEVGLVEIRQTLKKWFFSKR